jgi:GTP cyclohydrolase-4
VRRRERGLRFDTDRQSEEPEVRLSLSRAGVSRVRRVVHLEIDGRPAVYNGEFSMVADLAADRSGVHMSRFAEILEEATLDVLAEANKPARIERLAEAIAREIVQSQRAIRADVRLRARFGLERWTPVSGKRGEETYTLVGIAHADESGTRRVVGVEAEGMTACPCAQDMVREHSMHQLIEAGFAEADARRALDVLPVATHNQRGRGSILIGVPEAQADVIRAEDLVEIVENSMSSETYDLLKRPDEFFVVNKAHHNPKFVEDVVRGILWRTLEMYADLGEETFVFASQVNEESIHKHDAFAEGFGLFGELRAELRTGSPLEKTDLGAFLQRRDARAK